MVQRKTTQFNMRMDPELKEVAEKAAAADRRSLSSLIEKLLGFAIFCRNRMMDLAESGHQTRQ